MPENNRDSRYSKGQGQCVNLHTIYLRMVKSEQSKSDTTLKNGIKLLLTIYKIYLGQKFDSKMLSAIGTIESAKAYFLAGFCWFKGWYDTQKNCQFFLAIFLISLEKILTTIIAF